MRRLLTVALTSLLVVALGPTSAHANWSGARRMDKPGWWNSANVATVAVARNGSAVMAWNGIPPDPSIPAVLRVRRISKSGALGAVRTLSSGMADHPESISVAVDADGDALLAWDAYDSRTNNRHVWARRLSKSGVAGPQVMLSDPRINSTDPVAALAPRGNGAVVFEVGNQQQLRRFSLASKPGKRLAIPTRAGGDARMVATRDGDFVTSGITPAGDVRAYRLFPSGRMMSRKVSSASATTEYTVDIGVDRSGTAYLTYMADKAGRQWLWARRWRRSGGLGAAHRIAPKTHNVIVAASRTDLQGDTIVTWPRANAGAIPTLYGRIWRHNGTLGKVHKLGPLQPVDTPSPLDWYPLELAVDDDGDGLVSWETALPQPDRFVTWARRVHRDGTFGPRVRIRNGAIPSALGMTPGGRARLAFTTDYDEALTLRTGP